MNQLILWINYFFCIFFNKHFSNIHQLYFVYIKRGHFAFLFDNYDSSQNYLIRIVNYYNLFDH